MQKIAIIPSKTENIPLHLSEYFKDAEQKNNSFNIIDLHWREHPDYTEQWAKENKPIIGQRMWEQEYECSFLGTGDTFIDRHTLAVMNETVKTEYIKRELCMVGWSWTVHIRSFSRYDISWERLS